MLTVIFILTVLNSIGIGYFLYTDWSEKYTICKREVYDEMADYYLKYHDEQGNELSHELAGGVGTPYYGFFQEQLEEEVEGDE